MGWNTTGGLPRGLEVEDVVIEAVEDVVSGKIQWDPDRRALLPFLMTVVKFDLINLYKSADNQRRFRDLEDGETGSILDRLTDSKPTPEEGLERKEVEMRISALLGDIRSDVSDDPLLVSVFDSVCDGRKPREAADEIGVSPAEVHKAIRKIKYRAARFRERFAELHEDLDP